MAQLDIKVAVIGAGYWGKNLIRVFSRIGVLDTICDKNLEELKQLESKYPRAKVTQSYLDVLQNKSINALIISTPAESHHALAKQSLLEGKDVFLEKPLALKVEDGKELIEIAKSKNKILMIGHILEYHPAIAKLKELIDKGKLGKIQYIYSNRLNLGKIRREENILWSFAPHDISVILLLLNEMPESVSAHGGSYLNKNIADVTVSNLNFSSGVKGHIFVSWLHPYKEQKLIIVGDKKMAVFDDVVKKDKILLFNHKINWIDRIPVSRKENAEKVNFKTGEPLFIECQHFLECIKKRNKPKTSAESALNVLKVLNACQLSLEKNGIPIDVDIQKYHKKDYFVHWTSSIDEPCKIGRGTKIWHYSHIMKGAVIGRDCVIGQNVLIASRTKLGNNVKIQNNVSIYDCVTLEDDVFCGPSMVFTNVINPRSHVARKDEYKETLVKKGASIGANATIICGVTIGEYAFIGAGALVTKDVPPYGLVYGNPAKLHGWMCQCGVKLKEMKNNFKCEKCSKEYKFENGLMLLVTDSIKFSKNKRLKK